jgi:hypothetical protein
MNASASTPISNSSTRRRLLTLPSEPSASGYTPEWTAPFEGYAANFIKRNLWKVARTHDRDDAWQEVHFVFYDCVRRYSTRVENAAHFMALFKTCLNTHFCDLAVKATTARAELGALEDDDGTVQDYTSGTIGETQNAGELQTKIRQAPSEVRVVLALFLSAPQELVDLAMSTWKTHTRGGKQAAGSDHHLNKMLGLPPGSKPLAAVEAYFMQE